MTYLLATGLMVILLMVLGVFAIVIFNGIPNFWPKPIERFDLSNGTSLMGEVHERKQVFEKDTHQLRVKIGNREVNSQDFTWIDEDTIRKTTRPEDAVLLERLEWGNAYGYLEGISFADLKRGMREMHKERSTIEHYEREKLVELNDTIAELNRKIGRSDDPKLKERVASLQKQYDTDLATLEDMRKTAFARHVSLKLSDGQTRELRLFDILHAYQPNSMGFFSKTGLFFSRGFAFMFTNPRESNTEGGVFPALYGTVLLVFLMSILVFPFGVIASVYLHEYAREGIILRLIRITIFNLAGVPSIVFGVFGLGFFIYTVGGTLDTFFFADRLPTPTLGTGGILWASMTLAVLTLPVVIVASLEGLQAVPEMYREGAFALGATKWEVIRDVVIPNAMPGMLTGLILAISRAAGEVAPLMLTGVVKSAPSLPLDLTAPFLHLDRKFMHLGFHIYDVGFQSPNVEAARPMVFTTTLLLLMVVFALNLVAIIIRNRLRKKFMRSGV